MHQARNMTSRISANESHSKARQNLNAEGARKFALASMISTELLSVGLSDEVRGVVTDKAVSYMGEAVTGLISMQSNLGLSQERVKKANTSIEAQTKIVKAPPAGSRRYRYLRGVHHAEDPADAA